MKERKKEKKENKKKQTNAGRCLGKRAQAGALADAARLSLPSHSTLRPQV